MRIATSVFTVAFGTALLFGADVNAGASTPKDAAVKLLAESRSARQTASTLANQLKDKNADLSKVGDHIAAVEQNAAHIQQLLETLESNSGSFNAKQKEALDTSKKLAELMNVFLNNKKQMTQDGASSEEREAIRQQALGAAKRAELLEKNVMRMGL
ncbi:MAG: hypothetical protein HY821_20895 [Acidobacteria bacterium]|nr:hypothetical protein [Acidobacteriota bacterium]